MAYSEYDTKSPFAIVLWYAGTVWPLVLPYCMLNCMLLILLQFAMVEWGIRISILPQGHALMSLLIAYLGVSKVNLAYERYMSCRIEIGRAFAVIRELNQYCITLTEFDYSKEAIEWRKETKTTLEQLIHGLVTMIKNSKHAQQLATNVGQKQKGDPYELIHYLRGHLYGSSLHLPQSDLQLLERCKMLDLLHEFSNHYRELVRLSSTPLPFALVQMGRTFIFAWVLSLPLVLSGKDFDTDFISPMIFVILLTYGFLGLEMVAMKLSNPFGDETKTDLNVKGMAKATILGMTNDSLYLEKALAARTSAQQQQQEQQQASVVATVAAAATPTFPSTLTAPFATETGGSINSSSSTNNNLVSPQQQQLPSSTSSPLQSLSTAESIASVDQRSSAGTGDNTIATSSQRQLMAAQPSTGATTTTTSTIAAATATPPATPPSTSKPIRAPRTMERTAFLSERILHAPSENLDDSIDELADDDDDAVRKKEAQSKRRQASNLIARTLLRASATTTTTKTDSTAVSSTLKKEQQAPASPNRSTTPSTASSPSTFHHKSSSAAPAPSPAPTAQNHCSPKHSCSMPPIHVSSMLPHFRFKPDWPKKSSNSSLVSIPEKTAALQQQQLQQQQQPQQQQQQQQQQPTVQAYDTNGAQSEQFSSSALSSIVPNPDDFKVAAKVENEQNRSNLRSAIRKVSFHASAQAAAEKSDNGTTTPYVIIMDDTDKHPFDGNQTMSSRDQWFNDSVLMQFSSSSSSLSTPYQLSNISEDAPQNNPHQVMVEEPNQKKEDNSKSSTTTADTPFLELV